MLRGCQAFVKNHQKPCSGSNWWKANQIKIHIVGWSITQRKKCKRRNGTIQNEVNCCDSPRRIKSPEHKWTSIQWVMAFPNRAPEGQPFPGGLRQRVSLHLKDLCTCPCSEPHALFSFKWAVCPAWGLNSWPWDQELHALPIAGLVPLHSVCFFK